MPPTTESTPVSCVLFNESLPSSPTIAEIDLLALYIGKLEALVGDLQRQVDVLALYVGPLAEQEQARSDREPRATAPAVVDPVPLSRFDEHVRRIAATVTPIPQKRANLSIVRRRIA